MTRGIIDTATVSQVVQCLDRGMAGQYPWSLGTVLDLTALLIREGHMGLAPGLTPPKRAVQDNQDLLIHLMLANALVGSLAQPDTAKVQSAITLSKIWIGRNETIAAVRGEVDRLLADKKNFQEWIDWAAPQAWLAHTRRLGGLFDDTYITYVARILNISEREALELHGRSRDSEEVCRLVAVRGDDFKQMTRAYVASTILRGRYHEELARLLHYQLVRHPLRGMVSKARTGPVVAEIDVSPAAWCLACFVLYGAVRQRGLEGRLRCWVDNIRKVRALLSAGGLQLAEGTGHAAVSSAYLLARSAGVQIVDSRLDDFLEIVASLGIGALASIYLSPWIGVPAVVATRLGLRKAGLPGRIRNAVAFHIRETMLKDLAAGRIETEWAKAGNKEM